MKTTLLILTLSVCASAQPFASPQDPSLLALAPDSLRPAFDSALLDAGQNWYELALAMADARPEHRSEVVWLINSMPHLDRLEMTGAVLLEHVEYAHISTASFRYRAPDSLFRDYILTYRVSDEPVTAWRNLLYDRFAPMVRKQKTAADAARIVNRWLAENIHAAKRGFFGPMKSPELVLSSGSGTSEEIAVLAAAILKSVGVPSRRVKIPWLGAEDYDASWLEVHSEGKWLPCYPLEPEAFGDFGWLDRSRDDNITVAVATTAFDRQLVSPGYTAGAQVRVRLTAAGVPLPDFGNFAISVFNAGAWRPLDELNTFTDSSGAFDCFLGNGHYLLVAGQRDPRGDPYIVTREFEVEPSRALDIALDLTVPATEAPPYARTSDFTNLLPNTAGGVSSTLPPRGEPGIVISFDPALPVTLQAFKAVQQLYEDYGKKGLYVLGIAHADVDAARSFALKNGMTFAVACKPGPKADALGALSPENYGHIVVYDKDGTIVLRKARPRLGDIRELNRKTAALLK
ncbi:redoxin domain-containing protein [candidate division WOR-3 bacterium]|nr:redoxin domain-containing protein [candidate division WOR-3 bacterium]